MGDHQYSLPDLRQVVAGRNYFEENPQPTSTEPFFIQNSNLSQQTYNNESIMLSSSLVKFTHQHYRSNFSTTSSVAAATSFFGLEMENNSRWPRQETLTLLDIRSRLDSRFKEANQKGPLWDEVSRIMAEEHGYQRSGKKCREKFENLYKYYKKTKEGKAGRQDGKHYRFFRQLEALYGETTNQLASSSSAEIHLLNTNTSTTAFLYQENQEDNNNKHSTDPSLSISITSETSSSENNNDDDLSAIAYMMNKQKGLSSSDSNKKKKKKNWKGKVKEFVDLEMRKLFERQEVWMEQMLRTIEDREHERLCREEEWTKKEAARLDQIHEFWAKERARVEARDVTLMEALQKYSGKLDLSYQMPTTTHHRNDTWTEPEIFSLIQIRTTMYSRFQENRACSMEGIWEEIARKMSSLGYNRDVNECMEKWESMNVNMEAEGNKKRIEDLRTSNYFHQLDTINSSSTSNSYASTQIHGNCFQVPTNDGEHLWSKYGFKMLSKEKSHRF